MRTLGLIVLLSIMIGAVEKLSEYVFPVLGERIFSGWAAPTYSIFVGFVIAWIAIRWYFYREFLKRHEEK